jgi:nucleotide-binding universal stress UspA family protein
MLVADNLEVEGRRALEAAIQLADELDCAEICHTYVHQLGVSEVQHMVTKVREAMNLGRIPPNPEFSSQTFIDQVRSKFNEELRYRFHNSQGAYRVRPRYDSLVAFGKPAEELHKAALQHRSQILVFGRHHMFHRRRLALGKIPYDAMMEQGMTTLIVPDLDAVAT